MKKMPASSNNKNVIVIIVTYGRRWHLLNQVLESLLANHSNIENILIVDNASEDCIVKKEVVNRSPKIQIVEMGENTGPGSGFKTGIETALKHTDAEFLWLLDDDNRPQKGSLEELLKAYETLGNDPGNALLSLRKDRPKYLKTAQEGVFDGIRKNSFLGFHIVKIPEIIKKKIWKRGFADSDMKSLKSGCALIQIEFAPYGGLLLHRDLIKKIGLPDENFYIYGDDHDYTSRVYKEGGKIYLCPTSEIEDIDKSWNFKSNEAYPLFSIFSDKKRIYYFVRNHVYLEKKYHVSFVPIFLFNMLFYLIILAVHGLLVERKPFEVFKRIKLILKAIDDAFMEKIVKIDDSEIEKY